MNGTCRLRTIAPLLFLACVAGCAAPAATPALPTMGLTQADRFVNAPLSASADTTARTAASAGANDASDARDTGLPWWRRFDDATLADWVERALAANPDIEIARERLVQAQARLGLSRAAALPLAIGEVSTETGSALTRGTTGRQPTAIVGIDWTLDLWGAQRQAERSAAAGALRAADLALATRLAVAATTARAYIDWREAQADAALLTRAERVQQEVLDVVAVRVRAGLSPRLDLDRARAEIAAVQAEAALASTRSRQARNVLQVLAGERPSATSSDGDIPSLRDAMSATYPVDLLRDRPDLRAAESGVVAAAADVGVARADLKPALRLQGTLVATSGAAIFNQVGAAVAALIDAVLYDGGAGRATVAGAESALRESLAIYRKTLLDALRQAEDALAAQTGIARQIDGLNRSLAAAEAAVEQARSLYGAGLSGFIDVLDARRTALRQQRELVRAKAAAGRQSVALFEAVGAT